MLRIQRRRSRIKRTVILKIYYKPPTINTAFSLLLLLRNYNLFCPFFKPNEIMACIQIGIKIGKIENWLTAMLASTSWSNLWDTFLFYLATIVHQPVMWLRIQYHLAGQRYLVQIHCDQMLATSWSAGSHRSWFGEQVLRFEHSPKSVR